ncbi:helicase-related protein, partial [Balneolaceae bacterium ANBcel3]|nr:helicase-related protein [Balneolaceae bacterium ANBcel3]
INEIQSRGYSSDVLHGDMSQAVRDKVMKKFRDSRIEILIATDVAARGLDIDDVDVVFNYDIPQDPEYYVHRVGRTGRAGKKGVAYTFATGKKVRNIRFLENKIKSRLEVIPLPSIKQVGASMMESLWLDVEKLLESGGLRPYIEQIEAIAKERFTPIEVAAALLKMRGGTVSGFIEKKKEPKEPEFTGYEEQGSRDRKERRKKRDGAPKASNKKKKKKFSAAKKEPFYAPFVKKKGSGKKKKAKRNKM